VIQIKKNLMYGCGWFFIRAVTDIITLTWLGHPMSLELQRNKHRVYHADIKEWIMDVLFYVYGSVHRWSILIIVQRDAKQSSLFIILQVHSTCFGCQPHPSSGVHKTVTTQKNMTSTGGCSYSFVYSLWWVWLKAETYTVNLQNNK